MSLNLDLSDIPLSLDYLFCVGMSLRWHMISICLIIGDINFDHSSKVVSARFIHHKVAFYSFVTTKYLVERYTETT